MLGSLNDPSSVAGWNALSYTSIWPCLKFAAYRYVFVPPCPLLTCPIARPVYTASTPVPPTCACFDPGAGTFGFQPLTMPTCDANRNAARPLGPPGDFTTKSVGPPVLNTVPVGEPSGMVTTSAFLVSGTGGLTWSPA